MSSEERVVGVFLPTKTLPAVRAELIDAVREGCVSTGVNPDP